MEIKKDANLRYEDLHGADLHGADLRNAEGRCKGKRSVWDIVKQQGKE